MPKAASASQSRLRGPSVPRRDSDDISFDSTHAREIELKRSRGEISCAECRRLKIRCDKTIPCQSCQRRGCAALCPNGSLATGQGTRFVLAATEHLHRRIAKMTERIRQLEDSLAIAHAKYSDEPHTLLTDDQAGGATDTEGDSPATDPSDHTSSIPPETIDALGTLSVSDDGVQRFFGPTGGTEYLLYNDGDATHIHSSSSVGSKTPESKQNSQSPSLAPEILHFSSAFPFSPIGPVQAVREMIEAHLPTYTRARQLAEIYVENAGWLFKGVANEQILDELLPFFYNRPRGNQAAPLSDLGGPHDLGLLLATFAIGALVDLEQEPANVECEHYFQLAKAALCLSPVMEHPTLGTIQTLQLFSIYIAMVSNLPGERETSMESSWGMMALSTQLAYNIGLHRDSARWGLPPTIVNRRRVLFWNIYIADTWQSLTTGRPPLISRDYIDCKFPENEEENSLGTDEESKIDFHSWGIRFSFDCVAEVATRTLGAETPTYATIMDLDRRVREYPVPAAVQALVEELEPTSDDSEPPEMHASMARFVVSHSREVILLYIHRSFFAQAIIDMPSNPLRSAYAPSFLAAYRASCTILKVVRDQFAIYPALCARFWAIWTFAFSAAVVFGTVATRGPRSPLASAAVAQLQVAAELFSQAAKHNGRAAKALPIVIKLREKAHSALATAQGDGSGDGALWSIKTEEFEDELEIFAGRTKLVATKPRTQSPIQHSVPLPPQHLYAESPTPVSTFDQRLPVAGPSQAPSPAAHNSTASVRSWGSYPSQSYAPAYSPQPTASGSSYRQLSYDQQQTQQHAAQANAFAWPHDPAFHAHTLPTPVPSQHYPADHEMAHYRAQPLLPASTDGYREQRMYAPPPPEHPHPHGHGHPHAHLPQNGYVPTELVDLGLAARDSRLDERWTSFIHQSGFLDGIDFRPS